MAATKGKPAIRTGNEATKSVESALRGRIDPVAPAGNRNSLGEESIRDGRPTTDDGTVEAIDEEDPGTFEPPFR